MASAATIRLQIESALARKIPSALTPVPRFIRPVTATGIDALDALLHGGLPIGAITELVGAESSGRTSIALSFLAQLTQSGKVGAWIDVSNTLDPPSAAATGVDLTRLLWIRCGLQPTTAPPTQRDFVLPKKYFTPSPTKKGLHGGGFGPHPRTEANGLPQAMQNLLRPEAIAPRCAEPQPRRKPTPQNFTPIYTSTKSSSLTNPRKPWSRIEQALRSTDLLLQAGGFSAIVLDMGSLTPEAVSRIPLATWFRYRAAAERTQSSILLLTQYPCAKSSAELLLRLQPGESLNDESTVFTGLAHSVEVIRRRFTESPSNVIPLRKPPQRANAANWQCRAPWASCR